MYRRWLGFILCFLAVVAYGAERYPFDSAPKAALFTELTQEMRCLVCQNQSLADSNAGLAVDLKNDIYHMVKKGRTREQITQVMVGRYGEFVLFAPPLSRHSALLWFLPLLLLLLGALVIWRMSRRARRSV